MIYVQTVHVSIMILQRNSENQRQVNEMNNKEICKRCIYYDDFCCRNNKAICVNNSEYIDADDVINALINKEAGEHNDIQ